MATSWQYKIIQYSNTISRASVTFEIYKDATKITTKTIRTGGGKQWEFIARKIENEVIKYRESERAETELAAEKDTEVVVSDH